MSVECNSYPADPVRVCEALLAWSSLHCGLVAACVLAVARRFVPRRHSWHAALLSALRLPLASRCFGSSSVTSRVLRLRCKGLQALVSPRLAPNLRP